MCANENTRLYGYKIIRNCCIATMLCVTLMSCNNTEKPVFNDDVTTDTDVRTSAFESDTEDLSLPEFSISDEGVLTAYNGTEYNISIPDNVSTISEDAFGASPVASEIKTIKLGKSVESIDTQAFVSLTALESIEVPEENTNYKFLDGVLFKNDNTLFFCMPNIIKDNYDMFDIFYDVISDNIDGEGEANLVSGKMMAKIEREYASLDDSLGRKYYFYCKAFSANGQYIEFDKAEFNDVDFNYKWSFIKNCAYSTSECIVYSYTTDTTAYGKTWLFTNDEIVRVDINKNKLQEGEKINGEEWYNYSVITFEAGEDGSLRYTRMPLKYVFYSGNLDYDYCWTGLDEFAKEIGYVKIENGNIVYYPEEKFTARDLGYDEDYVIKYLIKGTDLSVEEYFIQQSQRFESAK